jgi:hypothetical protein
MIKKLHSDFPVYVIENWNQIEGEAFNSFVDIILKNKEKYKAPGGASFWLQDDRDGRFNALYDKFATTMQAQFGLIPTADNYNICNVYYSNTEEASETLDSQGQIFYHNHKHVYNNVTHNATTVVGVYYVNVPDKDAGFIDFRTLSATDTHGNEDNISKDMRYTQISKRPHDFMEDIKTTIMREISYQPKNGDLVLFPSYLDHRPLRPVSQGHRVAINFELKTGEHPDESFVKIENFYQNQ